MDVGRSQWPTIPYATLVLAEWCTQQDGLKGAAAPGATLKLVPQHHGQSCVPAGYRHLGANQTDTLWPCSMTARISLLISPNQLNCLKVFIMHQTEVTAPDFSSLPASTFTWATIRFVVSLSALIGVSLLLASL
jgi:hypothetical protein